MKNVIETLQARGFIDTITSEEIVKLTNSPQKVYCGFDPTAESLHLGSLIAIMGLAWFQRFGHTPVALVGGATGMVGDPSGKSHERPLLTEEAIEANVAGIRENLERILSQGPTLPVILNNRDWFEEFSLIEFLRDVGKHFRLGPMLAKESVKNRLESDEGMSFTEFTYQVLQGYDFYKLFAEEGVSIQIGGSDQWGNITAGTELIRRLTGKGAYGATFPLLTNSEGQKLGKTEKGAIWLSADKLSPYEFYQYLYRIPDSEVIKLMRLLTFMELSEIEKYEQMMAADDYVPNTAQKKLAEEVTRIVHGDAGVQTALKVTSGAAPGAHTVLSAEILEEIGREMPHSELHRSDIVGVKLVDLLISAGFQESKGQGRRLIRGGGLYLNNQKVTDENKEVSVDDIIDGRYLLLASGKKNKLLIHVRD